MTLRPGPSPDRSRPGGKVNARRYVQGSPKGLGIVEIARFPVIGKQDRVRIGGDPVASQHAEQAKSSDPGDRGAARVVQCDELGGLGGGAPAGQGGVEGGGIVPDGANVVHGAAMPRRASGGNPPASAALSRG